MTSSIRDNFTRCLGALILLGLSGSAHAALLVDLVGDRDCFGLGGACADGDHYEDDLGGSFFTDNRSAGEVLGIDEWETSFGLGGPSFTFGLDLAGVTATSASIELFTAGIDLFPGVTFRFNGTDVGGYVEPFGQENRATTLSYDIPTSLLSDSNSLALSLASGNDGFIIDYVEFTVNTGPVRVPVPSTLMLMALALAGMAAFGRRHRLGS